MSFGRVGCELFNSQQGNESRALYTRQVVYLLFVVSGCIQYVVQFNHVRFRAHYRHLD